MEERSHDSFVGYRLFRAQRVVHRCLENALEPYGITPAQWNSLNQLASHGPMSQRELAAAVRREPATITRSLDRMEKAGLVERFSSPNDRRVKIIGVTQAGEELLREVQPAARVANERVERGFTAEEARLLGDLLDRVYENCREEDQA